MEKKLVKILLHDYGNYMGEQFVPAGGSVFDEELFTASGLKVMQIIADAFKNDNVNGIVNKSHEEDAWADNIDCFNTISYDYGFGLKYPANGN